MLHSAIVVREKGTIHGNGLFATELIRKGTLVWSLTDPVYTLQEILQWSAERRRDFDWYGFQCGIDRYSLPEGDVASSITRVTQTLGGQGVIH